MNNTEKNTQAWPSELAHSSDPSPLARLWATWTPLRAPAAHPGPVSEQKLGQLVQRAQPTPALPRGLAPPLAPSAAQHGKGGGPGPGVLWTRLLKGESPTPSLKMTQRLQW